MFVKRMLTGLLGFPLVVIVLVFGCKPLINFVFSIVAIISLYEYFRVSEIKAKPILFLGYLICLLINLISFIEIGLFVKVIQIGIPLIFLILFLEVIISNMKIDFKDVSTAFFGIMYVVGTILFIVFLYGKENGKILIWYILGTAWGTDVFAYTFGKLFGRHTFSKISPSKSIEGCIGGIVGSVIVMAIFTWIFNTFFGMQFSYLTIAVITVLLSALSQIGDFAASSIKRFYGKKDFGTIFPGHGGMLDRIDSVIFIAPFAYFLLMLI